MGWGTLQETRTFNDGTAIEISVAVIRPEAENGSYNETGIAPEFFVEYDGEREPDPSAYAASDDIQLKKAVEVILTKASAAAENAAQSAAETSVPEEAPAESGDVTAETSASTVRQGEPQPNIQGEEDRPQQ